MKQHFLAVCASMGYKVNLNEWVIPGAGNTYKLIIRDKNENEVWSDHKTVDTEDQFWSHVYNRFIEYALTRLGETSTGEIVHTVTVDPEIGSPREDSFYFAFLSQEGRDDLLTLCAINDVMNLHDDLVRSRHVFEFAAVLKNIFKTLRNRQKEKK